MLVDRCRPCSFRRWFSVDSSLKVRKLVDLPALVFNSEKYTKMHDDLAKQLFSLKTLTKLFRARDNSALVYFVPLCLLTTAFEEEPLTVAERMCLLEVGFYYMECL